MKIKGSGSVITPRPLRLLIVWPEAIKNSLENILIPLITTRKISYDAIMVESLTEHLPKPGYYHVLVIPVQDFDALSDEQRRQFSSRVNLLILTSSELTFKQAKELLEYSPAGIAFGSRLNQHKELDFLKSLCEALVEGQPIDRAFSYARVATSPDDPSPHLVLSNSEVAIWPKPLRISKPRLSTRPSQRSMQDEPLDGPSVYINSARFEAKGNQLNILRSEGESGNISQSAGGDQVNLNRLESKDTRINQSAQEDQININRIVEPSGKGKCPECGNPIKQDAHFCTRCGTKL